MEIKGGIGCTTDLFCTSSRGVSGQLSALALPRLRIVVGALLARSGPLLDKKQKRATPPADDAADEPLHEHLIPVDSPEQHGTLLDRACCQRPCISFFVS